MQMRPTRARVQQDPVAPQHGEEGIALLTTLVILLIMTVLGLGAVAVTALENQIAGFQRTGESGTSAAESCVGTSVNIIRQTLATGDLTVPAAFYATANDPVPNSAATAGVTLSMEIQGQSPNDSDTAMGAPDYLQTNINGYRVQGDIDFLYRVPKAGNGQDTDEQVSDIVYRIDCRATVTAVGSESRVVAIYVCTLTGLKGECQKQI